MRKQAKKIEQIGVLEEVITQRKTPANPEELEKLKNKVSLIQTLEDTLSVFELYKKFQNKENTPE